MVVRHHRSHRQGFVVFISKILLSENVLDQTNKRFPYRRQRQGFVVVVSEVLLALSGPGRFPCCRRRAMFCQKGLWLSKDLLSSSSSMERFRGRR